MNWIRKILSKRKLEDSWLTKQIQQNFENQKDVIKLLDEVKRLQNEEKIPRCFKKQNTSTLKFRVRTILGQYAHSYIDVLKQSEITPNMTLKEYFDL
jgi:hypothetical protein